MVMITTTEARIKAQEARSKIKEDWAKSVDKQLNNDLSEGHTRNIRVVVTYNTRDREQLLEFVGTYMAEGWTFTVVSDEESNESAVLRLATYSVSC
jgi:hypothetical protein